MTTSQIALLELLVLGGIGAILVIIGAVRKKTITNQYMSCTYVASGHVVDYYCKGDMRVGPIVEFFDEAGQGYKTKKKFRGYKNIVRVPSTETSLWEDEKGYLHTRRGAIGMWRACAEELWPIGSEMKVFYDPRDPMKNNYVDRQLKDDASVIFFLAGTAIILLGIIMSFVIQNA